ncbi:hypothetical protein VPHK443_0061 [Vibrio phage K443]
MKSKNAKRMICDVMASKFEQRFCWNYYGLMAEYDNPFCNGAMCWFEFDTPKYMRIVSLTADQLRSK